MKKWIALLALLAAFPPLSTDMYLPAIPTMARAWGDPFWFVNLTLVLFFVVYSFFLLIYGPISDRYGRRRILKVGLAVYILSSLLCAAAPNTLSLILLRMFQAAGAASAEALALAISKDLFAFRERESVLAYIGVVIALAPMLGPVIGGWTVSLISWRWIFVLLGLIGTVSFCGVHWMPETLRPSLRRENISLAADYIRLLGNRSFVALVLVVSLAVVPLFAFIAASSDIYISRLGLSERVYAYFFGLNAFALMAGSFVCTRISGKVDFRSILTICYVGVSAGGTLLLCISPTSPWDLTLPMLLMCFSAGLSRPPSNNLVLEHTQEGAGTASSLLIFTLMTVGAAGMFFISLDWRDKILVLGVMGTVCGMLGCLLWLILQWKWR